jgi:hypothetical protein
LGAFVRWHRPATVHAGLGAGLWTQEGQVGNISVQQLLEVLARFDEFGGASLSLVAWELFVGEHDIQSAWEHAITEGWLKPARRGQADDDDETLYRLTPTGRAAARERSPGLKRGPEAADESL